MRVGEKERELSLFCSFEPEAHAIFFFSDRVGGWRWRRRDTVPHFSSLSSQMDQPLRIAHEGYGENLPRMMNNCRQIILGRSSCGPIKRMSGDDLQHVKYVAITREKLTSTVFRVFHAHALVCSQDYVGLNSSCSCLSHVLKSKVIS